jgi:hypothetical protein
MCDLSRSIVDPSDGQYAEERERETKERRAKAGVPQEAKEEKKEASKPAAAPASSADL